MAARGLSTGRKVAGSTKATGGGGSNRSTGMPKLSRAVTTGGRAKGSGAHLASAGSGSKVSGQSGRG